MKKWLGWSSLLIAALAACGHSTFPSASRTDSAASKGAGSELLYVGVTHRVLILTYPQVKRIGWVASKEEWPTVCSDPKTGDVFVPDVEQVAEYAHGGTTPIAVFKAPAGYGNLLGCSIDPNSGDLAVVSYQYPPNGGQLLVYHNGKAFPTIYDDPAAIEMYYSAYDPSGNLYVMGYGLKGQRSVVPIFDELSAGSPSLTHITLDAYVFYPKKVQWDGKYVTLTNGDVVSRLQVAGSHGYVVSTTILKGDNQFAAGISWIQNGTILAPHGGDFTRHLAVWAYPAGGNAERVLPNVIEGDKYDLSDVTLSKAPRP